MKWHRCRQTWGPRDVILLFCLNYNWVQCLGAHHTHALTSRLRFNWITFRFCIHSHFQLAISLEIIMSEFCYDKVFAAIWFVWVLFIKHSAFHTVSAWKCAIQNIYSCENAVSFQIEFTQLNTNYAFCWHNAHTLRCLLCVEMTMFLVVKQRNFILMKFLSPDYLLIQRFLVWIDGDTFRMLPFAWFAN